MQLSRHVREPILDGSSSKESRNYCWIDWIQTKKAEGHDPETDSPRAWTLRLTRSVDLPSRALSGDGASPAAPSLRPHQGAAALGSFVIMKKTFDHIRRYTRRSRG